MLRTCFEDHTATTRSLIYTFFPKTGPAKIASILEDPILVPIMVDGYYFAASVGAEFRNQGKRLDFAMLGCHRHRSTCVWGNWLEPYKVYIAEQDEAFLRAGRERPVLLLDDSVETGKTIDAVLNYMARIGCKRVLMASEWISRSSETNFVPLGLDELYVSNLQGMRPGT